MSNDQYTKSWYWRNNREQEETIHRKVAEGVPMADAIAAVKPKPMKVRAVMSRVFWWKAADRFDIHYGLDGNEGEYHFWFILPWLFGFSVTVMCDWDWFKRRHPTLVDNGTDVTYSLSLTRDYLAVYWGDRDTMDSTTRKGFHLVKDWWEVFKGKCTEVVWSNAKLVAEKDTTLRVTHRSDRHPVVPFHQPVRIRVYRKVGTWHYSRWFPRKQVRWEVECDQTIMMPGKGENDWDCGDWEWGGYNFNEARQSCNFSCAAKNAADAIQIFKDSFHKAQQRG